MRTSGFDSHGRLSVVDKRKDGLVVQDRSSLDGFCAGVQELGRPGREGGCFCFLFDRLSHAELQNNYTVRGTRVEVPASSETGLQVGGSVGSITGDTSSDESCNATNGKLLSEGPDRCPPSVARNQSARAALQERNRPYQA